MWLGILPDTRRNCQSPKIVLTKSPSKMTKMLCLMSYAKWLLASWLFGSWPFLLVWKDSSFILWGETHGVQCWGTKVQKLELIRSRSFVMKSWRQKNGVWIMKMLHHAYGKGVASSWGMPEYKSWFETKRVRPILCFTWLISENKVLKQATASKRFISTLAS